MVEQGWIHCSQQGNPMIKAGRQVIDYLLTVHEQLNMSTGN